MVKLTWKNSELCSKRVIYLDLESQYPARVKFCINLHEKSITITLFILFTYFLISCFFDKDKHMNKPFLIFTKIYNENMVSLLSLLSWLLQSRVELSMAQAGKWERSNRGTP